MNNILLIDKPYSYSSFQVTTFVKNILSVKKVGHGGTLDPLAVGMLPICIGESRKFASFLLESEKHYTIEAKLGLTTTTGDLEGDVVSETKNICITQEDIEKQMSSMIGTIPQKPPAFSALKYQGRPLYEYARQNIDVPRPERDVDIIKFKLLSWSSPILRCEVQCGKGTYIRTLLEMLGEHLGVGGATLTHLRRDWVAPFQKSNMLTLEELYHSYKFSDFSNISGSMDLSYLFQKFNRVDLSTPEARTLAYGQEVRLNKDFNNNECHALYHNDIFFGLGFINSDNIIKVKRLRQSLVQDLCSVT